MQVIVSCLDELTKRVLDNSLNFLLYKCYKSFIPNLNSKPVPNKLSKPTCWATGPVCPVTVPDIGV